MSISCAEALQLLGFPSDLQSPLPPADAIRRAFRQQALLWHPDKHVTAHAGIGAPSLPSRTSGTKSPLEPTDSAAGAVATSPCTSGGDGACPPLRSHTQAQATEHFKRLGAAYHVLLQASAAGISSGLAGRSAAGGWEAGGEVDEQEEEHLLDELSVELLLMEAQKLRLSDFDMLFLHQRASGGAATAHVWPEAAQSVDDVWRRIRRRVERRRKRRAGGGDGGRGVCAGSGGGPPGVGAKWALLSEFLVDILGATTAPSAAYSGGPERSVTPPCHAEGGAAGASEAVDGPGASTHGDSGPRQQQRKTLPMQHEPAGSGGGDSHALQGALPGPERPRGRLPPGFYWRWLKRLVAARLLFFVFFNG